MSDIWTIYNDKVVPFENTDDDYKKIMDGYYDEWKNFGDGLWDFGNAVWDVGRGLFDAAKDLVTGVLSLLAGAFEILLWLSVKGTIVDTLGLIPEKLDADVKGIWNGALGILSDPGNALEAMGQGIFDTADENGIAYSVSYVTFTSHLSPESLLSRRSQSFLWCACRRKDSFWRCSKSISLYISLLSYFDKKGIIYLR